MAEDVRTQVKSEGLWCGMKIPIIGLTGEKWSGKTLFASSIDPTRSLMIDLESSSETYNIPFKKRYNLYEEVIKKTDGKPPTALDCYLWFHELVSQVKPGEYSCVIVDPISDIEAGLTQWVQANPEAFGHTKGQYERASGIMWGDLQAGWKLDLGVLASKVETFAFTAHIGSVWGSDGRPQPGKTKPKGKSVLMELASLYLQFERKPDQKGVIPSKPVARVLKSRLAITEWADGEMKFFPVLPGTVPDCDPNQIRKYIKSPVGKRTITEAERAAPEVSLTEDEKLLLKSQVVGEMLQIEQAKASRLEMMRAAAQVTQQKTQAAQQTVITKVATTESQMPVATTVATTPAAVTGSTAEPAKRTRRTKEQIEADNAAEAAKKAAVLNPGSTEIPVSPKVDVAVTPPAEPNPDATPPFGTAEKPLNPAGEPRTVHQTIMAQFAELNRTEPGKWSQANFSDTLKNKFGVDSVYALAPDVAETLRKKLWSILTSMGLSGDGDLMVGNS